MCKEEVQARIDYARKQLEFCIKLYRIQLPEGSGFLHEHFESAKSWQQEAVKKFLREDTVSKVIGDQCQYGLTATDQSGTGPARKATGFLTNSLCIAGNCRDDVRIQ